MNQQTDKIEKALPGDHASAVKAAGALLDRHTRDVIRPSRKCHRVYISGPMTGLHNENREEFARVEALLDGDGVNPHRLAHNHGKTRQEYMRVDLRALLWCDAVLMLRGWEQSAGARFERETAIVAGIPVFYDVAAVGKKR
jgi:hypothetical protein